MGHVISALFLLAATIGLASGSDSSQTALPADTKNDTVVSQNLHIDLPTKVVKGRANDLHHSEELGRLRLSRQDIQRTTATQGDPMRVVSTLPGVNTQNDISVRPFIRGGKAEETRVLLDGILLLQPYHIGGAYSPFNPELVERLDVYRASAPASMRDALSGTVAVGTREPETWEAIADVSMLRANAVVAAKLPGKVTAYLGWHSYYYDQIFNAGLNGLALVMNNSSLNEYRDNANAYLDMPNFRDFQTGLFWHPNTNWTVHWNSIWSKDVFNLYQPAWRYYSGNREVSPSYYDWANIYHRDGLRSLEGSDTLAGVEVGNQVHSLKAEWKASPHWRFTADAALQNQNWGVDFKENRFWIDSIDDQGVFQGRSGRGASDYAFHLNRKVFQTGLQADWSLGDKQLINLGMQRETWIETYDTHLPRSLAEKIVNGNNDVLEGLAYTHPNGALVSKDLAKNNYETLSLVDLVERIRFDYKGNRDPAFSAAFLSDRIDVNDKLRLELGIRLEHAELPNHWFASPRFSFHQQLTPRDELSAGVGLYAQSDLPFNALDGNPNLLPEKAVQSSWSLTHAFGDKIKFQIENWYKWYYDLAVPHAVSTGIIDWRAAQMDSVSYKGLKPAQQKYYMEYFSGQDLVYTNSGKGKAQGLELSVNYHPNSIWTGWFSGEQSISRRQDHKYQAWVPYRYHRPWALNWVNSWHMPSDYTLGTRLRYAAGQAYTPYSGDLGLSVADFSSNGGNRTTYNAKDTLLWIGPRNSGRFAPYMRFDIRISHESTFWNHPCETYFEVWNAWNNPNFLLRDAASGEIRMADFNYPIPILFFGMRWHY